MITRRHIRRWLIWAGVGLGALGIAGYVLSFIAPITHTWANDRRIQLGRGAIAAAWMENDSSVTGWALSADTGTRWRWMPRWSQVEDPFNKQPVGQLVIPYWVLVLIGAAAGYALLPAGYPRGRCAKCGYDLKGVPADNGTVKCPECGEPASC